MPSKRIPDPQPEWVDKAFRVWPCSDADCAPTTPCGMHKNIARGLNIEWSQGYIEGARYMKGRAVEIIGGKP